MPGALQLALFDEAPELLLDLRLALVGVGQIDVSGIKVRRDWNLLGGTVRGRTGSGDGALTLDLGTGSIRLDVVQPVSAN